MRILEGLLIAIVGAVIGTILWESSLLSSWRTGNPLDFLFSWLGSAVPVLRVVFAGLLIWFVASVVYFWHQARRIRIHSASYDSNRVHKDVTEILREEVEQNRMRRIPVTNELLRGDPDPGSGKILTVQYSVWGRRKKKTAGETEHLKL